MGKINLAKQNQYVEFAEKDSEGRIIADELDKGIKKDSDGNVDITGDLDVGGDLAVTGSITTTAGVDTPSLNTSGDEISAQKPVVEVMNGYAFTLGSKTGMSLTPIYVGACKNGNKLTIVFFVSFTRTDTIQDNFAAFGSLTIPDDVLSKLYPYSVGDSSTALDYRQVGFYKKIDASQVLVKSYVEKVSNGVMYTCTGLGGLELNSEYVVRFENTFLLSDNLAA